MLKIAIVGTGKVAENNYLPILSKEPDVLLGYYNRTEEKSRIIANKFGGSAFKTIPELMDWKPDSVFILTREMDRFDVSMEVLKNKPARMFFEKPLVAKLGQENVILQDYFSAKELIAKAESIHCDTAMVFNYRFFEHVKKAKAAIDVKGFGRLLNISAFTHYACWSHVIDLIHFFAGPISRISAFQGKTLHATEKGGGMTAYDITACFTTNNDATGTLIGTTTLPWIFPLFEISMNFEGGRVRFQDLDGDLEIFSPDHQEIVTHRITNDLSRWDHYNASFKKSVSAYLDSIRNSSPVPVPGITGLLELQVEAAIKQSIARNRPVILNDEFPL